MRAVQEWRRKDLLALTAFLLFFFLYANIHALHSDGAKSLEDVVFRKDQARQPAGTGRLNDPDIDPFDPANPANETLGFGAIVAVSSNGSKRRESLLNGARVTDLQITIPEQPRWTDQDVEQMKDEEASIITRGSALAWLGHLNAVKWFLDSGLSTALIIEDDVDWDIHIRNHQVPVVAAHVRELLATNPAHKKDQFSALREHNREQSYWGDLTQWEVLYLGHCGDYFDLKYLPDLPHNIFHDDTVPSMEYLHPDTQIWLMDAGVRTKERMIHRSKQPLCSFAYALNRKSAERMLAELSHEEFNHGTWSFDVRLLEACRDMGWKCWTANPELFHHQDEHDSAISDVNGQPLFELDPDEVWDGFTPNIGCGARSPRFSSPDPHKVDLIRKMAQHKEVCSIDQLERIDARLAHAMQRDPL